MSRANTRFSSRAQLQRGDAVFEEHYTLPAYVRKAVGPLLACRTARLGVTSRLVQTRL